MNTKTFAQLSRTILMDGVSKKLLYWGFSPKGEVLEEPTAVSGGYTFRGDAYDDVNVPRLWTSLKNAIAKKGIEVVVEEAAYTWFNRMMAMRILAKNGYDLPQLEYAEGLNNTPIILQKARQGQYAFLNDTEKIRLQKIIGDYNKETEAFALLLVGYCHSHNTLNKIFGKLDDYTELLLPDNMLQDSGFLHLLNTTDAISDEEYQQVELIGWLYQFYISEKKDDVFASFKKGKKAEAKDIPAATQIFTPNWIVKYMVENTAGKIWLDKHPDSPIKEQMKYLVSSDEGIVTSDENHSPFITNVEDLTLLDPAVGSGHILVEGFDLLYQMYMEEYYTPEEAVESILKNNLYGLDLDDRAAQLANFAILLKAATKYRDVFAKGWLPNVYAMPESRDFSTQDLKDFLGEEGKDYLEELDTALRLMKQAKNLGSTMKLSLSEDGYAFIQDRYQSLQKVEYLDLNLKSILQGLQAYIPILLTLTKKFAAVVANPPYMGQKSMNTDLKNYVNANYPITKSDLMTVFMEVIPSLTRQDARFALINLPSWLFLSSFEKIRNRYIEDFTFDSLLHMGRGIFGIDFGSVAFAIKKSKHQNSVGSYFRLHERNFQHIYFEDIEKLFLYSNGNPDYRYDFAQYRGEDGITLIPEQGTKEGMKLFYPNIPQSNFSKIPGSPIAYWVSEQMIKVFKSNKIYDYSTLFQGIITGNNSLFLRYWFEVNSLDSQRKLSDIFEFDPKNGKWVPYNKGGNTRKWYGNQEILVNFKNKGKEFTRGKHQFSNYFFKPNFSWSYIASGDIDTRYFPQGFLWDVSGSGAFPYNEEDIFYFMSLVSSRVGSKILKILNPTINCQVENIAAVPVIYSCDEKKKKIIQCVKESINLSKTDWNFREFSWDFKHSPLLNETASLEKSYDVWQEDVTKDFFQLHANEEELNRIFIDIYGLQEELTPEVALKDITILQEELDRKQLEKDEVVLREKGLGLDAKDKGLPLVPDNYALPIDKAEVMQQFISYAIGLFMGRYRLDKPGLNIAHPNPTVEELASYEYNNGHVTIDSDAIIPLMGTAANFKDDALYQIQELLDTIWGAATRTENLNFLQDGLNKDLEKYLVKDFWKYHCKTYKKKPIYWLFSSKKGAFQVLVYMHRMNAFTVEKIRANYLLEHLKYLNAEITALESNEANLNTQQARKLDQLRKDLVECEEYDMHLKNAADAQITFDLDDGVTENYKLFTDVVAKIK